jgi:hypothetical protein
LISIESGTPTQKGARRKNAERHFRASVKTSADYAAIFRALENYRKEIAGKDVQYIKNGDTWFNNWKDYLEEINAASNGRASGLAIQLLPEQREKMRRLEQSLPPGRFLQGHEICQMFNVRPTPIEETDSKQIQQQFFEWERKHGSAFDEYFKMIHAWEDHFVKFG